MSHKYTILIVDDEKNIAGFITTSLTANGFNTLQAHCAREAVSMISSHCPDIILLDLGLPDADGLTVIEQVRKWSAVPIIVVSARTQENDKIRALDLGADDYITKPFGTGELLARIRTAIKHANHPLGNNNGIESGSYTCGDLLIDYNLRRVFIDGKDTHLTLNEYKIVSLLAKYAGKVLTYDFIYKNIWGPNGTKDNQILRVNMANIRRKIEKNPGEPQYIFTETGVGYRMEDPGK